MQQIVQRISRVLTGIFAGGAALSMVIVFLITFINSVRRYTVGKSFVWGEEMPVYTAIYGVMFGMAYAYMQDRHVRFTMLVGFLPEKAVRWVYILVDVLMVAISSLLAWSGWLFMNKRGGMESSGLIGLAKELKATTGWDWMIWLGHFYPYQAAMVLGGVLLAVAALVKLCDRLLAIDVPGAVES